MSSGIERRTKIKPLSGCRITRGPMLATTANSRPSTAATIHAPTAIVIVADAPARSSSKVARMLRPDPLGGSPASVRRQYARLRQGSIGFHCGMPRSRAPMATVYSSRAVSIVEGQRDFLVEVFARLQDVDDVVLGSLQMSPEHLLGLIRTLLRNQRDERSVLFARGVGGEHVLIEHFDPDEGPHPGEEAHQSIVEEGVVARAGDDRVHTETEPDLVSAPRGIAAVFVERREDVA